MAACGVERARPGCARAEWASVVFVRVLLPPRPGCCPPEPPPCAQAAQQAAVDAACRQVIQMLPVPRARPGLYSDASNSLRRPSLLELATAALTPDPCFDPRPCQTS